MRAAAEIQEAAAAVKADLVAGCGEFGHEVGLHEVAVPLELRQGQLARLVFANKRLIARDYLGHFRLDPRQVFRRERLFAIKIIKKARICGRSMAQLGLRIKFEHRRGQHVRGGVAHHLERLGVLLGDQFQARIGGERRGHVHQARGGRVLGGIHGSLGGRLLIGLFTAAVALLGLRNGQGLQPRHHGGCRQPRRNRVGNLKRRRAGGNFANCPVGKVYGDGLCVHGHEFPGISGREKALHRGYFSEYTEGVRNPPPSTVSSGQLRGGKRVTVPSFCSAKKANKRRIDTVGGYGGGRGGAFFRVQEKQAQLIRADRPESRVAGCNQ